MTAKSGQLQQTGSRISAVEIPAQQYSDRRRVAEISKAGRDSQVFFECLSSLQSVNGSGPEVPLPAQRFWRISYKVFNVLPLGSVSEAARFFPHLRSGRFLEKPRVRIHLEIALKIAVEHCAGGKVALGTLLSAQAK